MKRGATNLCLVVGVDKPVGMSSHDVVNRCRKIFGERRVGHTGTLDPMASGVLPICVGPATRLDQYLTAHDKTYQLSIVFGAATDTDDAEGEVIRTGAVPEEIFDPFFAASFAAKLIGPHKQIPPVYSAIKVQGQKACDQARKGTIINLEPRDIEVYDAQLVGVYGADGFQEPRWDMICSVSKGTYIRALARDIGNALGCPAHLGALRRVQAGEITLDDCVSLEVLEEIGVSAALDPVRALAKRFAFVKDETAHKVSSGNFLAADNLLLFEFDRGALLRDACACTSGVHVSDEPLREGEIISLVCDNRLIALYEREGVRLRARCVFQTGVIRGGCDI